MALDEPLRVWNPLWLKILIVAGTALFLGLALASSWIWRGENWSNPTLVAALLTTIFCGYLAYRGFVLCRFLNFELEIDETNVSISRGDTRETIPRSEVQFKAENVVEVLSIYRPSGELAYCVDYYAVNARELAAAVVESDIR